MINTTLLFRLITGFKSTFCLQTLSDGYNRKLTNKGRVLINGEYANIIGRICMDQFMVDITNIEDVNVGDEVVLFGEQKDRKITTTEIANICDTINYEILCGISDRVRRVYII